MNEKEAVYMYIQQGCFLNTKVDVASQCNCQYPLNQMNAFGEMDENLSDFLATCIALLLPNKFSVA